ncbi:hypothetical protein GCM10010172_86940 [Paractinoplanes ferrugineus]|uniref:Cellulase (Glycosyl hydrolase family 5) n=1 Tax=Paractinoplanes ferrugineus TaxID=113564 RepID=A0A919MPA1_9ACTN|nr:glycosyl hydrolase [Actinoplanes ferrugineus]GIE15092.1 hypothetical protein Afe05nite_69320 [Actinoplanes ferrugineus]
MPFSRRRAAVIASTVLLGLPFVSTPAQAATPVATAPVATAPALPTLASRLAAVKAAKTINYYPANAGWSKMWTNFNAATVDADMAKADVLGATTARAIIFPATFGFPALKPEFTAKLATFVDIAEKHGMNVKFTLFDWWGQYSEVANSFNWANNILKPYRDDPRVISVELQNEFDVDDPGALVWAKKIVPLVRTAYPAMPLTFSVNGEAGAAGMGKIKAALTANPIDYYDYHYYGNSERALQTIRQALATVAPTPMVIGETGLNTLQNTEGEQAAFLARVFKAASTAGVQSVAPWTLTDFATGSIPDSGVGKIPAQYNYGLYRTNGTAKAAAAVVRSAWTGSAMPATLMDWGFENPVGLTPWRAYLPELGQAVKTQTQARTGNWSVTLANTGKSTAGSPSFRVAPIAPVYSYQKWHAEVWARGNAATGTTQISLSWFDLQDKWLGGASSATLPVGTTNWTRLTVDAVAPAGSASMQIHLKSGENKGTVWFDDMLVTAG